MNNYRLARDELSRMIKIKPGTLTYVLYIQKIKNSYEEFEIPKKNGGSRIINSPKKNLKKIQRNLGSVLYEMHSEYLKKNNTEHKISHGFQKDRNIITNAKIHRHKKYLLNIDISDFFGAFHFGRIQGYFYKSKEFGFSKEVSTIIAQLVCYNGKLPQGAPTSPVIANLIFNIVDLHILELARKYKLDYTRYADDMSFSTNSKSFIHNYNEFLDKLQILLNRDGFDINENKTRLEYSSSRQKVTGLTVNDKINPNRNFIKETRAMACQLYKTGEFKIENRQGNLNQLEGRFSFINQLDQFNNKLEDGKGSNKNNKHILRLNSRERQFQYFLFYRYFFMPEKPTIVTEGKTDIIHLKAALKKYHNEYPELITVKEDGKFEFKICFLRRTKRLNYFLGISKDGADTMKNIWCFYDGKNHHANIYGYIKNKSKTPKKNKPVILLFDNEQKSKKPLKEFLKFVGIDLKEGETSKCLRENLYIQTIPLKGQLNECEIEDLYHDNILNIEIEGKKFNKDSKANSEYFFGKHRFSLYVWKNYKKIDFSNFKPILNDINKVCETFSVN